MLLIKLNKQLEKVQFCHFVRVELTSTGQTKEDHCRYTKQKAL